MTAVAAPPVSGVSALKEYSVPVVITVPPDANLTDAVFLNAAQYPTFVSFRRRDGARWVDVTAKEFAAAVLSLAKGLVAKGVKPGDRVALMSRTRYEWTLADYAIWTAGAVTVPVYETSSAEQVSWILEDSGAVGIIVETATHVAVVETVEHFAGWTAGMDTGDLDELAAGGTDVTDEQILERRSALNPETLATLIYTSGTTGRPKGCELTHRNLLFDVMTTVEEVKDLFGDDSSTLMFLPLAHVFGRIIQVGCVQHRTTMGHSADIKNLLADFQAFRPTFILAVPRVFEKVYNTATQTATAGGGAKAKIFGQAEAVAIAWSEAKGKGGSIPLPLQIQHALFDRLVYVKLRAAMGGKIEYAVSGGGPLGARLGHFYRGIGITILEGYGLTETTGGTTMNRPHDNMVGTVGRPVPGVSVAVAPDGELLLKGENVFRGYWNNEKATRESIDADGWFHSGDLGAISKTGHVSITGRKKEIIVTAGGKNVAPAVLEDRLRAHPLVDQCMVVGDAKPYIACLVTLDPEALVGWAKTNSKSGTMAADLLDDADLKAQIAGAVAEANKAVSNAEAIKSWKILATEWTEAGGQLTPSLKMKRNVVMAECKDVIDEIYAKAKD